MSQFNTVLNNSSCLTLCRYLGTYAKAVASSSCTLCAAGKFAPTTRATGCSDCPNGTAQSATGQSSCDECEAGEYQSSRGQTGCVTCDQGTWSHVGSTSCDICENPLRSSEMNEMSPWLMHFFPRPLELILHLSCFDCYRRLGLLSLQCGRWLHFMHGFLRRGRLLKEGIHAERTGS